MNWSASLAPQGFVREDWAKNHGLPHFLSQEFSQSVDFVKTRMGAATSQIQHNVANSLLIDGAMKLGHHIDSMPVRTFWSAQIHCR